MSTATAYLPVPKEIRDLLGDLLDKQVDIKPGPPFGVGPGYPASVATFVDDTLTVRAVVAMDLPLSIHVGAALALVPASQAVDAISGGRASGAIAESLREVFNIISSVFNVSGSAHLRLHTAQVSGEPLPMDALARTQILGRRCDFLVTIAGYGTGRIGIVLV